MKKKKIPMRTCVVTKEAFPKFELIRIVNNNDNVSVDLTGKLNGRGAYLKKDLAVVEKAKKTKVLERHLKIKINDDIYENLTNIIK
ncbi:MAG: RNase P modulator RnpM [Bacilli bacterium]